MPRQKHSLYDVRSDTRLVGISLCTFFVGVLGRGPSLERTSAPKDQRSCFRCDMSPILFFASFSNEQIIVLELIRKMTALPSHNKSRKHMYVQHHQQIPGNSARGYQQDYNEWSGHMDVGSRQAAGYGVLTLISGHEPMDDVTSMDTSCDAVACQNICRLDLVKHPPKARPLDMENAPTNSAYSAAFRFRAVGPKESSFAKLVRCPYCCLCSCDPLDSSAAYRRVLRFIAFVPHKGAASVESDDCNAARCIDRQQVSQASAP